MVVRARRTMRSSVPCNSSTRARCSLAIPVETMSPLHWDVKWSKKDCERRKSDQKVPATFYRKGASHLLRPTLVQIDVVDVDGRRVVLGHEVAAEARRGGLEPHRIVRHVQATSGPEQH